MGLTKKLENLSMLVSVLSFNFCKVKMVFCDSKGERTSVILCVNAASELFFQAELSLILKNN